MSFQHVRPYGAMKSHIAKFPVGPGRRLAPCILGSVQFLEVGVTGANSPLASSTILGQTQDTLEGQHISVGLGTLQDCSRRAVEGEGCYQTPSNLKQDDFGLRKASANRWGTHLHWFGRSNHHLIKRGDICPCLRVERSIHGPWLTIVRVCLSS